MNRRDQQIGIKVSKDEKKSIEDNARKQNMTLTDYIVFMCNIELKFKEFIQSANKLNDQWENDEINHDEAKNKWAELNERYSKLFRIIYSMDSFKLESAIARMNRLIDSRDIK